MNIFLRKLIASVLALLVGLSLFGAAAFSYSGCGEPCCCANSTQQPHFTTAVQTRLVRNGCATIPADPCGLNRKQKFESPVGSLSDIRSKIPSSAGPADSGKETISENKIQEPRRLWQDTGPLTQSCRIYLRHLSLLI